MTSRGGGGSGLRLPSLEGAVREWVFCGGVCSGPAIGWVGVSVVLGTDASGEVMDNVVSEDSCVTEDS